MPNAQCQMLNAKCSMPNAQCSMPIHSCSAFVLLVFWFLGPFKNEWVQEVVRKKEAVMKTMALEDDWVKSRLGFASGPEPEKD